MMQSGQDMPMQAVNPSSAMFASEWKPWRWLMISCLVHRRQNIRSMAIQSTGSSLQNPLRL
jgi:hypothetical protein